MFDGYNYVKNFVQTNLKDYDTYFCHQMVSTKDFADSDNLKKVYCYFGKEISLDSYTTINNIQKACIVDLRNYYSSSSENRIECLFDISSMSYNTTDVVYTNLASNYPSITSDFELQKDNNLAYNQNFMYLIPFSMLLVVLALWWFRK